MEKSPPPVLALTTCVPPTSPTGTCPANIACIARPAMIKTNSASMPYLRKIPCSLAIHSGSTLLLIAPWAINTFVGSAACNKTTVLSINKRAKAMPITILFMSHRKMDLIVSLNLRASTGAVDEAAPPDAEESFELHCHRRALYRNCRLTSAQEDFLPFQ